MFHARLCIEGLNPCGEIRLPIAPCRGKRSMGVFRPSRLLDVDAFRQRRRDRQFPAPAAPTARSRVVIDAQNRPGLRLIVLDRRSDFRRAGDIVDGQMPLDIPSRISSAAGRRFLFADAKPQGAAHRGLAAGYGVERHGFQRVGDVGKVAAGIPRNRHGV